jgi:hypothetical protein
VNLYQVITGTVTYYLSSLRLRANGTRLERKLHELLFFPTFQLQIEALTLDTAATSESRPLQNSISWMLLVQTSSTALGDGNHSGAVQPSELEESSSNGRDWLW